MKNGVTQLKQLRDYPKCMSCGSTYYKTAYVNGTNVIACSDCCIEYDADDWAYEYEEMEKEKYEYE